MAAKKNVNLTAKWQLDAALLSRPVDLTALVSMARSHPEKFLDDNTLQRLVTLLLNEKNKSKSDKDTKLDVLTILANVAAGSKKAVAEVRERGAVFFRLSDRVQPNPPSFPFPRCAWRWAA